MGTILDHHPDFTRLGRTKHKSPLLFDIFRGFELGWYSDDGLLSKFGHKGDDSTINRIVLQF